MRHWGKTMREYEKPSITRLGTIAELTLTGNKQWGFSDAWLVIEDIPVVNGS